MRIIESKAVISAQDRTGGVFATIEKKIRAVDAAAAGMQRRVGMIERATAAIDRTTGPLVAGGLRFLGPAAAGYGFTRAIKRFGDTEMAITRIGITADATDAEIEKLQRTLRDLAFEAGKPFDEVTQGLEQLTAGGMDLPQAVPAMPAIVRTAQAAGAEVRDMANTALALGQNLGIASGAMQDAFDILVAGGKAGKFELKDMARYLPSIMPAAVAVGMKGEAGLKRIVALLQAVRMGTGSTEEAASSVQNIFAKMESEETAKRFSKFGVDLRAEMAKARKEGRDLLEVFVDLTKKATKGDLSKIPQLFSDMEFARGMRALLSFGDLLQDVLGKLNNAKGSAAADFDRVTKRSQVAITRLSESWDRAVEAVGRLTDAVGGSSLLNGLAKQIESALQSIERLRDPSLNPQHRADKGQPQTVDELRDRLLDMKNHSRLKELDDAIAVALRDVDAADATAKKRPGLGRDPTQARAKLERLQQERDALVAAMRPQQTSAAPPATSNGARSPAHVVDRDLRTYFGLPPGAIPASPTNGARLPAHLVDRDMTDYFGLPSGQSAIGKAVSDVAAAVKAVSARPIEAKLTGGANVNVNVNIEPSPDFLTRVKSYITGLFGPIRMNEGSAGTTGSTGRTMPEAEPTSP